ncbi:MAG: hypothetical protein Kow0069_02710 [Promethearchaeota archaeon]
MAKSSEVIETVSKRIIEQVREYAIEEGILGRKHPKNPNLDATYELHYPPNSPHPQRIMLLFPKDQNFFIIQMGVQVSPVHAKAFRALEGSEQAKFFSKLKREFHKLNALFSLDPKNLRWMLQEVIYEEGSDVSKNFFFERLRRVFNCAMFANTLLNEVCLPKMGSAGQDASVTDGESGTSLYM